MWVFYTLFKGILENDAVAVGLVGLVEEYPCIYPEEGIFRKKLYNPDKECTVFLTKRFRRVFDRYAVITTIIGLVFGLGMGGLLLAMFLF